MEFKTRKTLSEMTLKGEKEKSAKLNQKLLSDVEVYRLEMVAYLNRHNHLNIKKELTPEELSQMTQFPSITKRMLRSNLKDMPEADMWAGSITSAIYNARRMLCSTPKMKDKHESMKWLSDKRSTLDDLCWKIGMNADVIRSAACWDVIMFERWVASLVLIYGENYVDIKKKLSGTENCNS